VEQFLKILFLIILLSLVVSSPGFSEVKRGRIKNANLKYHNETTIVISPGEGECNGHFWRIKKDILYELKSLHSQESFIYIYIDDANSDYPKPAIYDSTGEPNWDEERNGWYYNDDRCIGVVWSPGDYKILKFRKDFEGGYAFEKAFQKILEDAYPPVSWETIDLSSFLPVNTKQIYFEIKNNHSSKEVEVVISSFDGSGEKIILENSQGNILEWLKVSHDLSVKWKGNNVGPFDILVRGYQIKFNSFSR